VLIFTGFLIFQSFITGYFTIHHFIYTTRSGFLAHSSVVILISGLSPALFSLFLLLYPSMLYGLSGKNLHHIHPSGRVVESDTSPLKVSGHGATDQPFQSVVTIAVEDQTEWPEPRDLLDKVEIEAVLKTLINGKNIFPDQNFTIYSLAIALEIPVHRLRTYFHVRGESFSEFRNRLRVERAKELLKSGESKRFTLEAIGNMSGFSSNVSFFNEFRKITGTSPMQYAREHQAKIIA
jgi:AraC-like DNA-binding protein